MGPWIDVYYKMNPRILKGSSSAHSHVPCPEHVSGVDHEKDWKIYSEVIKIMINISTQNIFNLAIKNIEIPVLGLTIPWITLTPISIIWFSTLIYVSRISISSIKSTFAHVETSCVFLQSPLPVHVLQASWD